ncbi:MAG: TIGR00282 family metallophosphoesterase [Caldisericia bacterium]|nr:TIGR00282 family metallophosphoesterase [Caldisericia bacterium]
MRILFIGDVIGKAGRRVLKETLQKIINEEKIDLVIANVENLSGGFGVTLEKFEEILSYGVSIGTSGNHIWDNKEYIKVFEKYPDKILRPLNYPDGTPGKGSTIFNVNGNKVLIINIQGRTFMEPIDCPFRKIDEELKKYDDIIIKIVDFHAEATSEKRAMLYHLSGRVSALIGTHTHVQTADEEILPTGTSFITDVGMTGSFDSVIGIEKEKALFHFITRLPTRFEVASGDLRLNSVLLEINEKNGKTLIIKRYNLNLRKEGVAHGEKATGT